MRILLEIMKENPQVNRGKVCVSQSLKQHRGSRTKPMRESRINSARRIHSDVLKDGGGCKTTT